MSKIFCGAEGRDHQKPLLSRVRTTFRSYNVRGLTSEISQSPFACLPAIQVASLEGWVLNTHYYVSVGRQDKQKLKLFPLPMQLATSERLVQCIGFPVMWT